MKKSFNGYNSKKGAACGAPTGIGYARHLMMLFVYIFLCRQTVNVKKKDKGIWVKHEASYTIEKTER